MVNEEIEMKPSLALLRFGDGLKGHERRSVRAVGAPLDRHVRASGRPRTPRVSEEAFPERGQLRRVSAVDRDSHLPWRHESPDRLSPRSRAREARETPR